MSLRLQRRLGARRSRRFAVLHALTGTLLTLARSPRRYQVAMERAQIFLNLLDLIWGEIVAAGGLVEGEPVAQPQGSIEVDEQML